MTFRPSVAVAGCVIALVLTLAPFAWHAQNRVQTPAATNPHGSFNARLQPTPDGIGSTKDLPAVPLAPKESRDATRTTKDKRHELTSRAR